SLWWPSIARNKRSIVLDLRRPAARDIAARLAETCDVVLENFRPGQLDKWGLSYDALVARNPKLVMVHVSGFGQTGPLGARAGFGAEVVVAANADNVFVRLSEAMRRPDLATDPRFATHQGRGTNMAELDELVGAWTVTAPCDEILATLDAHGVPAGRIFTAPD